MRMTRLIWIQLAVFIAVTATAAGVMFFGYMQLPGLLFGVGQYTVTVHLPSAAGLYERANVTYRGTKIGAVESVRLTETGVVAILALRSDIKIPSDVDVEVHSQSAVGEQYVALVPAGDSASLRDGDVIPVSRSSVPPPTDALIDAANRGLEAIPGDNLRTAVDESFLAFGGLGPEIARIVKGSTALASDARRSLDDLTALIDTAAPVLQSQADTSESIHAWAAHLATLTTQLKDNDVAVAGVLTSGTDAAAEAKLLVERLKPTLPVLLANLAAVAPVLVTYHDSLEQLLVLLPQATANMQAVSVANRNTKQDYRGAFLSFGLNLNLPPPCTTGFLPAQQRRVPTDEEYLDRPPGDLYCRVPQDSPFNVRGARNTPCVTRPGKRAPTWQMCESDEEYVPLNDGFAWKDDPNSTLTGQSVPQLPPQPQPPIAAVPYDPATGTYVGPDGALYTQSDLAQPAAEKDWQSMLLPPGA